LCWPRVDLLARRVTLDLTKSGKVRHVPLTDRAVRAFQSITRFIQEPHVFVRLSDGKAWKDPRKSFHVGRRAAGLEWAACHDLRHSRATHWVKHGMPLREVQAYLGHADIHTTMRYAHFAADHAWETAQRIEKIEAANRERLADNWTTTAQGQA